MRPDGRCGVAVDGDSRRVHGVRETRRESLAAPEVSAGQLAMKGLRYSLRGFFSCRPSRVISQPRPRFRSSVSYTD
jgi:hypothetical protein